VALLLMLDERSWRSASKVRIINCNHELVHRITHCLPPGEFNLSGDCGELETLQ